MRSIVSKVSPDIEILFKDKPWPDRVTVSADEFRYTVYAAEKIFTNEEMKILSNLARPNAQTDNSVFRLARVEDKALAENYGFSGDCAYFLRALSPGKESFFTAGTYHEVSTAGWTIEVDTQEPYDPEFFVAWLDVHDLGERRVGSQEVLMKTLFETTHATQAKNETSIFCGNELVDKSVIAILVDKIWQKLGVGDKQNLEKKAIEHLELPSPSAIVGRLKPVHKKKVTPDLPAVLDAYRLCYSSLQRQESYLELLDAAQEIAKKEELPDYRAEELLEIKTQATQSEMTVHASF